MNFTSGDGVAACVSQWEVQNYVLARFSSMPSWTTMLILYFYQSLRKILNDFDNQNFFANFYSNVILKRKKLVLTLKSTGKMFSIMIPSEASYYLDRIYNTTICLFPPLGHFIRFLGVSRVDRRREMAAKTSDIYVQ